MGSSERATRVLRQPLFHFSRSYDESGQMFTEQSYKPAPMGPIWTFQTRGSSQEYRRFVSPGPGCADLWDMAVRTLLVNLDSLTPEALSNTPLPFLERIWKSIERR